MADQPLRGGASWRQLAGLRGFWPMMASRTSQMFGFTFTPIALQVAAARSGHGEPLVVSAILFASFVPAILLGPLAGAWVERWDKRLTMFWSQLARMLFVLLAVVEPTVPSYIAIGLLMGVAQAFYLPAYRALLPEIAGGDDLHMRASALSQSLEQVGKLVGTGLGAFLVVFAGVRLAFALNALVLGGSALFAVAVPRSFTGRAATAAAGGLLRQVGDGFRAVRASPLGRELVVLVGVLTLGGVMINPLLVLIPRTMLHAPIWWFGVFEVGQGVAMALLGGLMASGLRWRRRTLILGGFLFSGLTVLVLAASHLALVDVAAYTVLGFANMAWLTPVLALYRLQFPLAIRARASAVYSMVLGISQAIGVALGGIVATVISVQAGLALAGIWLVGVALVAIAFGMLKGADPSATVAPGPAATA